MTDDEFDWVVVICYLVFLVVVIGTIFATKQSDEGLKQQRIDEISRTVQVMEYIKENPNSSDYLIPMLADDTVSVTEFEIFKHRTK